MALGKITYRIPTDTQYGYVELVVEATDDLNPVWAKNLYDEWIETFKTVKGAGSFATEAQIREVDRKSKIEGSLIPMYMIKREIKQFANLRKEEASVLIEIDNLIKANFTLTKKEII